METQKTENLIQNTSQHTLFQLALFQSVAQGEYYGVMTAGEFKRHGDFGMGIFEAVNGELIMVDGVIYQALYDGTVVIPDDDTLIPYGNAVFYCPDFDIGNISAAGLKELEAILDREVAAHGKNQFYFARISGMLPEVTVRSELKQSEPFKMLNIALRTDQRSYSYKNTEGTIVGLYCPDYMKGMNAPGWHFHFISRDAAAGGHMTAASLDNCRCTLCKMSRFDLMVPDSCTFNSKDLGKDVMSAIREAEKGEF